MGDPAGVGPELCLRLLRETALQAVCTPVVVGCAALLERVAAGLGWDFPAPIVRAWEQVGQGACVFDVVGLEAATVRPGTLAADCGDAAFRYVMTAIDAALAGHVQGVTTAPLNKEALHLAGHRFPGHTEIFAERMRAARSCMMQYSELLTCTFATVHVGYAEVPLVLTTARILEVLELTHEALLRIRGRAPRMLVCGLNPHAGEHGLFGDREEERIIAPAVALGRAAGLDVTGPVPPDTAFTPARRAEFDAVVCMYHDQGHIPIKMIAFDCAVNTTLGLPVIRTSVDHGTAFDIAWKGKADAGSLYAAVRLAAQLARS